MLLNFKYAIYYFLWISEQIFGTQKISWSNFRNSFYEKHLKPSQDSPNSFTGVKEIQKDYLTYSYLKKIPYNEPLIFRGLINETKAIQKWNWEYIRKKLRNSNQPFTDTFSNDNFNSGVMNADTLIENILSENPQFSIMFGDLLRNDSTMLDEIELKKWIAPNAFKFKLNKTWQFFAAGKKRNTNLHSELGSGLILQIIGEKRWVLFSSKYTSHLNPKVNWKMYLESSNYSDFSKIKNGNNSITGFEVLLKPGDVLYCPGYFWHFVTNETAAVSVSFKWTEPFNFLRYPLLSFFILTSRAPSVFFRLPGLKRFSNIHPPIG